MEKPSTPHGLPVSLWPNVVPTSSWRLEVQNRDGSLGREPHGWTMSTYDGGARCIGVLDRIRYMMHVQMRQSFAFDEYRYWNHETREAIEASRIEHYTIP